MFDYKKLTTEQLTEIYETAKQEIIRRKQVDIAKLQVELSALENENVTQPRQRRKTVAPHFVGYYYMPSDGADQGVCWARWSRGRFPACFSGMTEHQLREYEVSKEHFIGKITFGEKVVLAKYGYDENGRNAEQFLTLNTDLNVSDIQAILKNNGL